ncbi:DUF5959 family protein [Kitasatospora sp. NPDC058444]|uniref:DUF5959 family protein n=1 Tax=Kitasatospora sp. NPDC058444 TaxID=3346504 RepID=UPI003657A8A8
MRAGRPRVGGPSACRRRPQGAAPPGTGCFPPDGHDRLDYDITVTADPVRGRFVTLLTDRPLSQWETVLDRLDRGSAVRRPDEEHGPELRIEPARPGGLWATVSDAEERRNRASRSGSCPPPHRTGWTSSVRLTLVREACPTEVVDLSPGVHTRRGTPAEENWSAVIPGAARDFPVGRANGRAR